MIYWRSAPESYLQHADRNAILADSSAVSGLETFDFLTKLESRYVAGAFRAGSIAFDPADSDDNRVGNYDDLRDKFVRELPAVMYVAVEPKA